MQYRCYVSSFRCGCTLCLAVFIAGDCYDVGTSYWGWLCGTNYVRTKVNSFPISWPILSDNNLLTVSEMERNELLALIVFLEHVPRFFCSLFAEILISGLYYSLRTPFLHLLCAIRRHLFLRAFRYILFFFLSSLCSDLGLLPVLPQSWNCICCTKLCTWFRGRLSPFWTLYLVTLNWRSLRCIVNRPLLQCSGCFVCVCVCVCVRVSIAETAILCSFIVVCPVVYPLRPATLWPVLSHNSYQSNYRCVWCAAVKDIIRVT